MTHSRPSTLKHFFILESLTGTFQVGLVVEIANKKTLIEEK